MQYNVHSKIPIPSSHYIAQWLHGNYSSNHYNAQWLHGDYHCDNVATTL